MNGPKEKVWFWLHITFLGIMIEYNMQIISSTCKREIDIFTSLWTRVKVILGAIHKEYLIAYPLEGIHEEYPSFGWVGQENLILLICVCVQILVV